MKFTSHVCQVHILLFRVAPNIHANITSQNVEFNQAQIHLCFTFQTVYRPGLRSKLTYCLVYLWPLCELFFWIIFLFLKKEVNIFT